MGTLLSLCRRIRGPVEEAVLVSLVISLACLIVYVLPSLRLMEEKRVSDEFNVRFDRAVADLQRMQADGLLSAKAGGSQRGEDAAMRAVAR